MELPYLYSKYIYNFVFIFSFDFSYFSLPTDSSIAHFSLKSITHPSSICAVCVFSMLLIYSCLLLVLMSFLLSAVFPGRGPCCRSSVQPWILFIQCINYVSFLCTFCLFCHWVCSFLILFFSFRDWIIFFIFYFILLSESCGGSL